MPSLLYVSPSRAGHEEDLPRQRHKRKAVGDDTTVSSSDTPGSSYTSEEQHRVSRRNIEYHICPENRMYRMLLAPHFFENGIANDWRLTLSLVDTRQQQRSAFSDDGSTALSGRHDPHQQQQHRHRLSPSSSSSSSSAGVEGSAAPFNRGPHAFQPTHIPDILVQASLTLFDSRGCQEPVQLRFTVPPKFKVDPFPGSLNFTADHLVAGLSNRFASQWMWAFPSPQNSKTAASSYVRFSGARDPCATFRPARLILGDATLAQMLKDDRAGSAADHDELYLHPMHAPTRSMPTFGSRSSDDAGMPIDLPGANATTSTTPSPITPSLVVCGNPMCREVGIDAGHYNGFDPLQRCSRCKLVY